MKKNANGNVELYDFQVRNHIDLMEHNIKMLRGLNDPMVNHIAGYFTADLDTLKKNCGIPVNLTAP